MLIETIIIPRKDGTVTDDFHGRKNVFVPGEEGRLVCDINDAPTIARLLATGNFFPAESQEDIEDAASVFPDLGKLDKLDKQGLLEYAKWHGVEVNTRMSVETLRSAIKVAHGSA